MQALELVIDPDTQADLDAVAKMFRDYAEWLKADICLYDFEEEMKVFPTPYVPPKGTLVLLKLDGTPAGAVGVRPLEKGVCEMKRMYVRDIARGQGAGRRLAESTITWAQKAGYKKMRLDTLPKLNEARSLYASLGFRPCAPYNANPADKVLFFEKEL